MIKRLGLAMLGAALSLYAQAALVQWNNGVSVGSVTTSDTRDGTQEASLELFAGATRATGDFSLATGIGHATAASVWDPNFSNLRSTAQANLHADDSFTVVGSLQSPITLTLQLFVSGTLAAGDSGCGGDPLCGLNRANFGGSFFVRDRADPAGAIQKSFGGEVAEPGAILGIDRMFEIPFVVTDAHRSFDFGFTE